MSSTSRIVGVLELASKYRYGLTSRGVPLYLFKPYDATLPDYIVGSSERDTARNRIAVVTVPVPVPVVTPVPSTSKSRANLVRLLGPVGDPVAERAALVAHYCEVESTGTTEGPTEDPVVPTVVLDAAHGWQTFHVDPAGCRDVDDAIAIHVETGELAITIADVAAAVPVGSTEDAEARALGATFYDLDGGVVRPMLRREVSEDAASLRVGQKRRGVTLFASTGEFVRTWITVEHGFTYESFVDTALHRHPAVNQAEPHAWIADLMIRYNTAAAKRLVALGAGLLRVQDPAKAERIARWPTEFRFLANEAASYAVVDGSQDQKHATLGTVYCHATSPLRRYADLVNQRILVGGSGGPTPALCRHLNTRMRANRRWTRDLTFLTHVTPGRVHTVDVVWLSTTHVWVSAWKRVIRVRHTDVDTNSTTLAVFCDPTKRNWKERVLTSQQKSQSSSSRPPS